MILNPQAKAACAANCCPQTSLPLLVFRCILQMDCETECFTHSSLATPQELARSFLRNIGRKKNLKNWLATAAVGTGRIIVSTYLADLLHKKSPTSILFSGIEKIEGTFNEKDVVDVCDIDKHILARGLVKYSSEDLRHRVNQFAQFYTGKRSIKSSDIIAIHYDYMAMM